MLSALVVGWLLAANPQQPPHTDLTRALTAAVDAATPAERAAAADALALRDVPLADWLAAAQGFGEFTAQPAGARVERAALRVLDKVEDTELWVRVPQSYDPARPAPLALLAHGTGARGEHMAGLWDDLAERLGMILVAPSEAGPNRGYQFSPRERAAALAALRWARRRFNVDENRIAIAGVSRGGHLAWDLGLRFPDRFALLVPILGGPRLNTAANQNNLRYLENLCDTTIYDLQGSLDDPRLVDAVRMAFQRLQAFGSQRALLHEFKDQGHSCDPSAVDWPPVFAAAVRNPTPERVVRSYACPGEGRAFFVEVLAADPSVTEAVPLRMKEQEWQTLQKDEAAMRRYLDQQAAARTARLEVTRLGDNRFRAEGQRVSRFRLLLSEALLTPQKPIVVTFAGRSKTVPAKPSAKVLLREFVERFDRRFLPIVEVEIR